MEASTFLSSVNEAKHKQVSLLPSVKLVRDKTKFERNLLRKCHEEMNQGNANGEKDLSISYVNGTLPTLLLLTSV